jgi:gamma-aminobutyric acid type B receptor
MDPLTKKTIKLADEYDLEKEILNEPRIVICKCDNEIIWIGVSFSVKAILLIMGLYLSYETRNAKIERINDAKFVSVSIYNIVVLAMVAAPVTIIIQNQLDASFFFLAFTVNTCSFLTLALVFLPKIKFIIRNPVEEASPDDLLLGSGSQPVNKEQNEAREKYLKLLKENEDLVDAINKREQLIKTIESILKGNKHTIETALKCNKDEQQQQHMSIGGGIQQLAKMINFEIQTINAIEPTLTKEETLF